MKFVLAIAFFLASFLSVDSAPTSGTGKNDKLRLKIIQHQPCTKQSTPNELIRFSNLDQAPLLQDPRRGEGYYVIKGPVQVKKEIQGVVQIYAESKFGTKAPIEECHKADSSNCGGVGSCVYCDACSAGKNIEATSKGLVQIESSDKSFDCQKGLRAGNYTDIRIAFSLPSESEIIKSGAIDDQLMNEANGQMFFITLYMFNQKVNTLSSSALKKIANTDSKEVIACHKIAGQIYRADD